MILRLVVGLLLNVLIGSKLNLTVSLGWFKGHFTENLYIWWEFRFSLEPIQWQWSCVFLTEAWWCWNVRRRVGQRSFAQSIKRSTNCSVGRAAEGFRFWHGLPDFVWRSRYTIPYNNIMSTSFSGNGFQWISKYYNILKFEILWNPFLYFEIQ